MGGEERRLRFDMTIPNVPRREFVSRSAAGLMLMATPLGALAQTPPQQPIPQRPDPIAPAMVQDFVRKAHADLPGTKTLARFDIFVAAMLGKLDIVRALLTTWPALLNSKGPHGIPLMRHAIAGGEPAREVAEYLKSLGAA
jgi:hypothetical protein